MTSDNKYLVDSINPTLPIITYEKQKVKSQKINFDNLGSFDVKSFDSPIGGITNLASNLYALKELFDKNSKEYAEIEKRIRMLRFYQGTAIDHAKGCVYNPPNKNWSHRQKYILITDNMTEEQKQEAQKQNEKIKFENSICCDKKTYFFGYVYPQKMRELKHYKKNQRELCYRVFGCKLKDLKQKQNKTEEEKKFLRNYYKYMPLFNSDCTMNNLAKYIEDFEFNKDKSEKYFDYSCMMSDKDREFKPSTCKKIKQILSTFKTNYAVLTKSYCYDKTYNFFSEAAKENSNSYFDGLFNAYKEELEILLSNENELVDYLIYVYYNQCQSMDRVLLWQLYPDIILRNIKKNSNCHYEIKESEDGQEFFGKKFVLKEVQNGV